MGISMGVKASPVEILTPTDMRRRIYEASYESPLIRMCLQRADYEGMSGEDRYTVLAYNALVSLETYFKRCLEISMLFPNTEIV